jgi:hypothetical protein
MKRKILACVVACATLFLGMGYAYWTDSLQIDTKATTGELKVNFVDLAVYGQYDGQDHETGWAIVDGVAPDGYTPDWYFDRDTSYNIIATDQELEDYQDRIWGYTQTEFDAYLDDKAPLDVQVGPYTETTDASNTIIVDLKKIYPGFAEVFQADIVNTGTVAAKLADLKVNLGQISNPTVADMIGINLKVLREYAYDPSEGHVNVFKTTDLTTDQYFTLGGVDFIRLSALNDLLAADESIINDLLYVLPDDNRMDIYMGIAMDPDKDGVYTSGWTGDTNAANDDYDANSEIQSAEFQIQFLFDQFNIDIPDDGSNGQLS